MTVLHHELEEWCREGFYPVPVYHRSKKPIGDGWEQQRITAGDLSSRFTNGSNAGVLTGIAPRFLADVDCDTPQAIRCASLLSGPTTHRIFGRASKPSSHYLFEVPEEFDTVQFRDPTDKTMVVELRGRGGQTVIPGSTHESGEPVCWAEKHELGKAVVDELRRWTARIGEITALAIRLPSSWAGVVERGPVLLLWSRAKGIPPLNLYAVLPI
jgi:Bifunctional DNA primase/polymerase, N-terminal